MNSKYCAQSHKNGVMFDHTYSADSLAHAEQIAMAEGWTVVGEFIYEEDCPEDMLAMIERDSRNITVH